MAVLVNFSSAYKCKILGTLNLFKDRTQTVGAPGTPVLFSCITDFRQLLSEICLALVA